MSEIKVPNGLENKTERAVKVKWIFEREKHIVHFILQR